MECNGYWERCNCEECTKVKDLYEDLEWYEQDPDAFKEDIEETRKEILSMGYFL